MKTVSLLLFLNQEEKKIHYKKKTQQKQLEQQYRIKLNKNEFAVNL